MGTGWLKPSQGGLGVLKPLQTNLESLVTLPLVHGDLLRPSGKSPFRVIGSICICIVE